MRILFILPSNLVGGAEISALNNIKYLYSKGYVIYICTTKSTCKVYEDKISSYVQKIFHVKYMAWVVNDKLNLYVKIKNFIYRSIKSGGWPIFPILSIYKIIKKNKIELVITNTLATLDGAIAAKISHKPHLQFARELTGYQEHSVIKLPFQKSLRLYNIISRFINGTIIYNSQYCKNFNLKYFSYNKNYVLSNSIEDKFVINKITCKENPENYIITIGTIANINKWKNLKLLINIAEYFKSNSDLIFQFNIYGQISDNDHYENLKDIINHKNLTEEFNFKGTYANAKDIYDEIDYLIHPTLIESFGRIYLEAMARGIPVIAAKSGASQEIINNGENGFLHEPDDLSGFLHSIESLTKDRNEYYRISTNALHTSNNYKLSNIGKLFTQIIESEKIQTLNN